MTFVQAHFTEYDSYGMSMPQKWEKIIRKGLENIPAMVLYFKEEKNYESPLTPIII